MRSVWMDHSQELRRAWRWKYEANVGPGTDRKSSRKGGGEDVIRSQAATNGCFSCGLKRSMRTNREVVKSDTGNVVMHNDYIGCLVRKLQI